jgi:hypothetical protein
MLPTDLVGTGTARAQWRRGYRAWSLQLIDTDAMSSLATSVTIVRNDHKTRDATAATLARFGIGFVGEEQD